LVLIVKICIAGLFILQKNTTTTKICKFGIRCRNKNCIFLHPEKDELTEKLGVEDKDIDNLSFTLPSTPPHLKIEE